MSWRDARCLVLGAGGFIGTNLSLALQAAGARVEGFGRRPHDAGLLDDLPWHDADFTDATRLRAAVAGQDFVFHLLGGTTPGLSNDDPTADIGQSLLPSVRLMEACRDAKVGRVVFASSGGTVYGLASEHPIGETWPTDPITAYGINKLAIEKYLQVFRGVHGLDSMVLRISNPFGPHQHARRAQGVIGVMLDHALARRPIEIWNDGSVVRDFIHVDDVVDAMMVTARHAGPQRLFNVGSGTGRSLRNVIDDICTVTGYDAATVHYGPARSGDVHANVLDTQLIRHATGWAPRVDWMAGLASTAAWFAARGHDHSSLPGKNT